MSVSDFEKELTALFKKHGITSTRMLCYNDSDVVAKYNEEMRVYNEQIGEWESKYAEWIKTNPEVACPQRYIFSGFEQKIVDSATYNKDMKKYDAWITKRDTEIGEAPQEPDYDLVNEEYDEEYTPGVWYSSRC